MQTHLTIILTLHFRGKAEKMRNKHTSSAESFSRLDLPKVQNPPDDDQEQELQGSLNISNFERMALVVIALLLSFDVAAGVWLLMDLIL